MEPATVRQELIDAHYFGVNTARYCSTLIYDGDKLLVPIGANIVLWDTKSFTRLQTIKECQSSISCLFENSSVIAAICDNASIVFFDKKTLKVVDRINGKGKQCNAGALNEDFLAICADEYGKEGLTEVYDIRCFKKDGPKKGIELVFSLEGSYQYPALTDNGTMFIVKEKKIPEPGVKLEDLMVDPATCKGPQERKAYKVEYTYHNFSLETKKETCDAVAGGIVSDMINGTSNSKDRVGLVYLNRQIVILNSKTLEILYHINITGTGGIVASTFDGYSMFFCPAANYLFEIKTEKGLNLPGVSPIDYKNYVNKADDPNFRSFKLDTAGLDPTNHSFNWINKYETAVTCNQEGNFLLNFKERNVKDVSLFGITCCGLALSHSAKMVAGGDFGGNLMIFSTESSLDSNEPLYRALVMDNSRTLVWDTEDKSIIIGGLSGQIYRWYFENPEAEPEPVIQVQGSVMNMKIKTYKSEKGLSESYLLVGTGEGFFYVFKDNDGVLQSAGKFLAHAAQTDNEDLKFGSLKHYSEIWSVTLSPNTKEELVTASEDQSCRVWNTSEFYKTEGADAKDPKADRLHTLTGHTLAVTSVDWKVMNETLGEIFISCSDDHHIRVYDPKAGFKFLYEDYTTKFTRQWHTLTYLALEQDGHRVAIGAQNGYLFIYDLVQRAFVFANQIHLGSIEGLDWKKDVITTCSADNTISVIRLRKP